VQPNIEPSTSTTQHKRKSSRVQSIARHDRLLKYTSQPAVEYEAALWEAYNAYVKGITPPPMDNTQHLSFVDGVHGSVAESAAKVSSISTEAFVQMVNDIGIKKDEDKSTIRTKEEKDIKREEGVDEKSSGEGITDKDVKKEEDSDHDANYEMGKGFKETEIPDTKKALDSKSLGSINPLENFTQIRHSHPSSTQLNIGSSKKHQPTDISSSSHMFTLLQNNGCLRYVYYSSDVFGFVDMGFETGHQLQVITQDEGSSRLLVHSGCEGDENLVHIIDQLLFAPPKPSKLKYIAVYMIVANTPGFNDIDRNSLKYRARVQLDENPCPWENISFATAGPSSLIGEIRDALQWGLYETPNDLTEYGQLMFLVNWKLEIGQHLALLDCEKHQGKACTCSGTCEELANVLEARQTMYTYRIVMIVFAWVLKVVGSGAFDTMPAMDSQRARLKFWRQKMNHDGKYVIHLHIIQN
jgi:hypothetical protein